MEKEIVNDLWEYLKWYESKSKEYQLPLIKPRKYPCMIVSKENGCDIDLTYVYKDEFK